MTYCTSAVCLQNYIKIFLWKWWDPLSSSATEHLDDNLFPQRSEIKNFKILNSEILIYLFKKFSLCLFFSDVLYLGILEKTEDNLSWPEVNKQLTGSPSAFVEYMKISPDENWWVFSPLMQKIKKSLNIGLDFFKFSGPLFYGNFDLQKVLWWHTCFEWFSEDNSFLYPALWFKKNLNFLN